MPCLSVAMAGKLRGGFGNLLTYKAKQNTGLKVTCIFIDKPIK